MTDWDKRWLRMAAEVSTWSKHPTVKVGCVIVDDDKNQLSGGYNGLPRRCNDAKILDQLRKHSTTVHAEANAVAAAARNGHSLRGAIAYVTQAPCCQCAALLIQAGISVVVFYDIELPEKWELEAREARELLREAQVKIRCYVK